MSNKDSQAAALAAFKALNRPQDPKPHAGGPKAPSSGPRPPVYQRKSHARSATLSSLPQLNTSVHSSSYLPAIVTPRVEVPRAPLSGASSGNSTVVMPSTPVVKMTKSTSTSHIADKDSDAESLRSGTDYFTLAKSAVYEAKGTVLPKQALAINQARTQETIATLKSSLTAKAAPRPRVYAHKDPQEMLSSVKQSIQERAKKQPPPPDPQRSTDMISGIRDSIDSKRITTSQNLSFMDSHTMSSANSSAYRVYNRPDHADSFSSVGSAVSAPESVHSDPPVIVTTDATQEELVPPRPVRSPTHSPLPKSANLGSVSSTISPINIPLSPGANAREAAVSSSENLDLLGHKTKYQSIDSADPKARLRRKPPPGMELEPGFRSSLDSVEQFDRQLTPVPTNNGLSSKSSLLDEYDSFVSDNEAGSSSSAVESSSKLPQFPGIDEKAKEHKHKLFKKKYKFKSLDASELQDLDDTDLDPLNRSSTPSRAGTPVVTHQHQPVQLKTTMRKTQKKKSIFNENKPWKNHTDLSHITEQQRKRYEGVWVTNKGLYIQKVVVKLAAVNYDQTAKPAVLVNPSLQAAQLSSQFQDITDADYFKKFHGLDSVEPNQLIHGVVVKRIWARSRLPAETLEQIWNLVDFRGDGTLNKSEFLVGMWLIDQSLYGRKLPKKVDNSVWDSLEHIGLSVSLKKSKRST